MDVEKFKQKLKDNIKINPRTDCWEWVGAKNNNGYGNVRIGNKTVSAHRLSYSLFRGEIPNGLHILHKCDNPICINPDHLFLGTNSDNIKDRDSKKRGATGERHGRAKLTEINIVEIRNSKETQDVLAQRYGVSREQINRIRNNRYWKT